jgi:hypothetical protein
MKPLFPLVLFLAACSAAPPPMASQAGSPPADRQIHVIGFRFLVSISLKCGSSAMHLGGQEF